MYLEAKNLRMQDVLMFFRQAKFLLDADGGCRCAPFWGPATVGDHTEKLCRQKALAPFSQGFSFLVWLFTASFCGYDTAIQYTAQCGFSFPGPGRYAARQILPIRSRLSCPLLNGIKEIEVFEDFLIYLLANGQCEA
jgi:hypothetical protein